MLLIALSIRRDRVNGSVANYPAKQDTIQYLVIIMRLLQIDFNLTFYGDTHMAKAPKTVETTTTSAPSAVVGSISDIDTFMDAIGATETVAVAETVDATAVDIEAVVAAVERDEAYKKANDSMADTIGEGASKSSKDRPKAKKEKATKEAKAPKEPKEKKERIFFSKQSERVAHMLGDKVGEFMLLELADASLTGDDLAAKNKEVLALFDADTTAKKVAEKAAMLVKWMHKGGELNEVMKRAFTLLAKDGELTSGDKGNLQVDLATKYSIGTARSQANQMFMLFPILKITTKEKGKMVANPNSLYLMKANGLLGL